MARRRSGTSLPSPFLKRIIAVKERFPPKSGYPFNLPCLALDSFEIEFTTPVTIIVGENGSGKSTLIEAIAALAGYDEAGGGKGYRPVDHSAAIDESGAALASALVGHWLPKVTNGWFFRAESFYSVARYLDEAARSIGDTAPDFLSWSHGEGFIRFFDERFNRQGIYFMDEPESALSPRRQIELLKLIKRVDEAKSAQIIMATHSPILMASPNARLLHISRFGLSEINFEDTDHFKLYREFILDPRAFLNEALGEDA